LDDSNDANKWPATSLVLDKSVTAYDQAGLGNFWVGTDRVSIIEKRTMFYVLLINFSDQTADVGFTLDFGKTSTIGYIVLRGGNDAIINYAK
jgi:hypothetical protein